MIVIFDQALDTLPGVPNEMSQSGTMTAAQGATSPTASAPTSGNQQQIINECRRQVFGDDSNLQLKATQQFRRILSIGNSSS